ncbi:MAG: hypothetical protein ACRC1K_26950 [Planctomycetia bacterium]
MERVTVEVAAWRGRMARSPAYWFAAALQGVAVTFAPLGAYALGAAGYPIWHPLLWGCLAATYFVALYHFVFSGVLIQKLRETPPPAEDDDLSRTAPWPS